MSLRPDCARKSTSGDEPTADGPAGFAGKLQPSSLAALRIPVELQFPNQATIYLALALTDATYTKALRACVQARGGLGVQQAAALSYLSHSRFSHDVHARFGIPYRTVELTIRMELSGHIVNNTMLRMSHIADLLGYSHLKKWDAAFTRHFGISASQFRSALAQNPATLSYPWRFMFPADAGEFPQYTLPAAPVFLQF